MDDDGPDTNFGTACTWLKNFLENWFPPDARSGTLLVVTFDEAEAPEKKANHIYTIFLGDMVKPGLKINPAAKASRCRPRRCWSWLSESDVHRI